MENLVQRNEKGLAITNSLLVAKKFEKEHPYILDSIRSILAVEKLATKMFVAREYEIRGKKYPMYIMTRDGFTLLAMAFREEKFIEFKMQYIEAFNRMEELLNSDEYILLRSQEILKNRVKLLESEVGKKNEIIQLQHETINELASKAEYTDNVLKSKDTCTITQIAKEFGISARLLNKKLKDLRIQFKLNGQWVLYAKYQNKGYTRTNTYSETVNGEARTWHSTVWTEKGRKFIYDLLKESILNRKMQTV